jgi:predicted Zn-dependent protease
MIGATVAAALVAVHAAPPALAQGVPGGSAAGLVVIRDAETETLLRTYATPLFRAAGIDPGLVHIVLIENRAINAFVSTGNRMFIYTGLIEQASSALELIGVMAHESGHIAGGHISRLPEQMREAMLKAVAAMLIGAAAGVASHQGDAAAGIAVAGQQTALRGLLTFTRAQEAAADTAGMTFLDRNQWSAQGLLDLFHRLAEQEVLLTGLQDPYLLTHPLTRDRIAFVEDHVAKSPYSHASLPAGFDTGFAMMKAKLVGFLEGPNEALRRYPESDHSAPARYARAIAYFRSGHIQPAVDLMDGLIAEQHGNPYLYELKGQILFEGQRGRDALQPYRDAARLAPDQPLIRASLGHVMIELNDPILLRSALTELQAAIARDRENAEAWHDLGIAWGRLDDLGQANLALAEEAMLDGRIGDARASAKRAEKVLPPGPSKLRAQDIGNAVKKENLVGE